MIESNVAEVQADRSFGFGQCRNEEICAEGYCCGNGGFAVDYSVFAIDYCFSRSGDYECWGER